VLLLAFQGLSRLTPFRRTPLATFCRASGAVVAPPSCHAARDYVELTFKLSAEARRNALRFTFSEGFSPRPRLDARSAFVFAGENRAS
jgi:predicted alternative tryptophan synthase beta-subunit